MDIVKGEATSYTQHGRLSGVIPTETKETPPAQLQTTNQPASQATTAQPQQQQQLSDSEVIRSTQTMSRSPRQLHPVLHHDVLVFVIAFNSEVPIRRDFWNRFQSVSQSVRSDPCPPGNYDKCGRTTTTGSRTRRPPGSTPQDEEDETSCSRSNERHRLRIKAHVPRERHFLYGRIDELSRDSFETSWSQEILNMKYISNARTQFDDEDRIEAIRVRLRTQHTLAWHARESQVSAKLAHDLRKTYQQAVDDFHSVAVMVQNPENRKQAAEAFSTNMRENRDKERSKDTINQSMSL